MYTSLKCTMCLPTGFPTVTTPISCTMLEAQCTLVCVFTYQFSYSDYSNQLHNVGGSVYTSLKCTMCLPTGFPTVTTPSSCTMLGCLNWPLMAASCRNLTVSFSEVPSCSTFTATSTHAFPSCHTPLFTVPNCPEPSL